MKVRIEALEAELKEQSAEMDRLRDRNQILESQIKAIMQTPFERFDEQFQQFLLHVQETIDNHEEDTFDSTDSMKVAFHKIRPDTHHCIQGTRCGGNTRIKNLKKGFNDLILSIFPADFYQNIEWISQGIELSSADY